MDSELKKLSRIVEGLFTLSMADAGQLRIVPEPLYLEEVIEEACALATPLANQKQIQIERKLERDVLFHGDAPFLRQLFLDSWYRVFKILSSSVACSVPSCHCLRIS